MTIQISQQAAIEALLNLTSAVESGPSQSTAQIIIWSGDMPANADDPVVPGDNLNLVTFDLPSPAFGTPAIVDGAAEALAFAISTATASEAGMASFYRVYDRDGGIVWQAEVGATGPGSDAFSLLLNQRTITTGAEVTIENLVLGYPL